MWTLMRASRSPVGGRRASSSRLCRARGAGRRRSRRGRCRPRRPCRRPARAPPREERRDERLRDVAAQGRREARDRVVASEAEQQARALEDDEVIGRVGLDGERVRRVVEHHLAGGHRRLTVVLAEHRAAAQLQREVHRLGVVGRDVRPRARDGCRRAAHARDRERPHEVLAHRAGEAQRLAPPERAREERTIRAVRPEVEALVRRDAVGVEQGRHASRSSRSMVTRRAAVCLPVHPAEVRRVAHAPPRSDGADALVREGRVGEVAAATAEAKVPESIPRCSPHAAPTGDAAIGPR